LTFAAGATSKTISVIVNGDTTAEPDETFAVNLSNPTNAVVSDAQATATLTNDDLPTLTIGDVTVAEGNTGSKTALFPVTLAPTSTQAVTVTYATANGTAAAGTDYAAAGGTLTFAAGVSTQTIAVTVNGDVAVEPDETFVLNLTSPTNAAIGDAQAVGTITNDDLPALSIADVSVAEGNSGTRTASFTVTLSTASTQTVTATFSTANGTATAGSDYVASTGTVTFAIGVTSQTVSVTVNGDTAPEPNETFVVTLSTPANADLADAQATGTITNDDMPSLSIANVSLAEGNSGTKNATFTVTLAPPSAQAVTVAYATANGSATAGADYAAVGGTLTFAAGASSQTITVTVNGDTIVEPDETFVVNLSSPSNAVLSDAQATGTIVNDDAPAVTIADVSVPEGNAGTKAAAFTVTLSAASVQPVTVSFATANGTATAGSDYVAASGTVTFAPGTTSQTIVVTVNGDTAAEADEAFVVNLSAPANAVIADDQATGTITNDDLPMLSVGNATVVEGNAGTKSAIFTVTLAPPAGQAVTVAYTTANGTATAGSDYSATTGTLTFAAGASSQTVAVTINGDAIVEADETFTINLSNPTNAALSDAQGVGTITNDDLPTLTIGNATLTEGNSGTNAATFAVTLSGPSSQVVTVAYATANVTASAGSDYAAASGTLTFAAGVTSQTVTVTVNGDTTAEADETFAVNLTGPTNATIADSQGVGTLTNDDLPALTIADVSVVEGNTGTRTATFTVTLNTPSAQAVSVGYATNDGTAVAGTDYIAAAGTLTFTAGQTTRTVAVTINGDSTIEADETFVVNLSNPTNAVLGDAQAVGTITSDDVPPTPTLTVSSNTVNPGGLVTVTVANGPGNLLDWVALAEASAPDATFVSWKYLNNSTVATVGMTDATLTFAAPATPGAYVFRLFENFGYTKLATSPTVTVQVQPTLSVNDVSIAEGDTGTRTATFTVTLAPVAATPVTVAYATADGTATAGIDYFAKTGTLTFPAGVGTQVVMVTVTGDTTAEPDETITLTLSGATNAALGDSQGIATITNDDGATPSGPSISVSATTVARGAPIVVTVANGPANLLDWVAFAAVSAPDSSYVAWKYLNDSTVLPSAGVSDATLHFNAPSTPGEYVFRFYQNYGYTRLATSVTVTVP
jgi:chitinase